MQNHLNGKTDLDNFELFFNWILGFAQRALPINNVGIMNCTVQFMNEITISQQLGFHLESQNWIESISESSNFLYQVDPIAKACIPAIYKVWLDSDEYWLTVEDPHRLIFNIIYRLDNIYDKSFDIYQAYEMALLHSDDPE